MENSIISTKLGRVRVEGKASKGEAVAFWVTGILLLIWSAAVPAFFLVTATLNLTLAIAQETPAWGWNVLWAITCFIALLLTVGPVFIRISNTTAESGDSK